MLRRRGRLWRRSMRLRTVRHLCTHSARGLRTTTFTDGLARLVAHEVDHLEGMLYVARMAPGDSTISVAEYRGSGQNWQYGPRSGT
ncbi:peptide deformylase [Streptomyces sp. V4I23]|uniref:peptide deformylase n=1 Tax=Streptomyces sp. V4I23 TaxID=3042282 RepID=UPI00358F84BC